MTFLDPKIIQDWHAHVYFDAARREAAWAFRQAVAAHFDAAVRFGPFNERLVGPHPVWSYEICFAPAHFARVSAWLILNHGAFDILLHPNTDDGLRDHRDNAVWIGHEHALDLAGLNAPASA